MVEKVFQNDRLTQAILINSCKRKDITNYCDFTSSALTQFEKGSVRPKAENVINISRYLKVNENFFYTPKKKIFIKNVAFRRRKTTKKEYLLQAKAIAEYLTEIKQEIIDKYVDLPTLNLPYFDYKISNSENDINKNEIEYIASKTREFWKLKDSPISNVVKLLEGNGVFVYKFENINNNDNNINTFSKIDAFSWWDEDKPIILLTKNKTAVRSRFDIAHELGHLILHKNIDFDNIDNETLNILEKEADFFAGCFLLPTKALFQEYISNNLDALFELKKRWKLSVQMIAMRLKNLNIIDEHQCSYVYQQLSHRGYNQKDPLDNEIQHEDMYLFKEIIKVLKDKIDIKQQIMIKSIYYNLGLKENMENKNNVIEFRFR